MPTLPAPGENSPLLVSELNVTDGAVLLPGGKFNDPTRGVCPSALSDCVSALAISERSALTADEEIVVPGTKGACGKVYVPDPFRGMLASY